MSAVFVGAVKQYGKVSRGQTTVLLLPSVFHDREDLVGLTGQTLADHAWHPLIVIGLFVVVFLEIRPFQDGNGRLPRVLTTLLLLQTGYSYVLYSSLESAVEAKKEA